MKSVAQPVMASGPSSVRLMLLTKSARELESHVLLFRNPEGGFPSPFVSRN